MVDHAISACIFIDPIVIQCLLAIVGEMACGIVRSLIFRQLFEQQSCTYTYILGCGLTKEAVIIDPVLETVERDSRLIKELSLQPRYALNTHVHADHVTGTGELKKRFPDMKTVLSVHGGGIADLLVDHGNLLQFGQKRLEVRKTPGHTDGCVSYVLHEDRIAFTGDALLIRGCGRTDFQKGDSRKLYKSVHEQLLSLPSDFVLYPAHDYQGMTSTTVQEENAFNTRFGKNLEEFVQLMHNLQLAYPKQMDKSVPANLVCGIFDLMDEKTKKAVLESNKH